MMLLGKDTSNKSNANIHFNYFLPYRQHSHVLLAASFSFTPRVQLLDLWERNNSFPVIILEVRV